MDQSPKLNPIKIEEGIKQLSSISITEITIKELEEILKSLCHGLAINALKILAGKVIYRGRRVCEKPTLLSELTYPKPCHVTQYGRLNDIGQPMFYGGVGRSVSFYELEAKVGNTVAISYWETKTEFTVNHIGYTDEVTTELNSNRDLSNLYDWTRSMTNLGELNTYVYTFLGDLFTKKISKDETHLYKPSIAIANMLLAGDVFGGLMYPTIAMSGDADNIALKPDWVDKHLEFIAAEFLRITDHDGTAYKYDILDSATEIDQSGKIKWTGKSLLWPVQKGGTISFEAIEGHWIGNHQSGALFRPQSIGEILVDKTP